MANNWNGGDPRLRLLRTVAGFLIMGLLAFVIIDPAPNDPATVGTLAGMLLVVLGFEAGIRWPTKGGDS